MAKKKVAHEEQAELPTQQSEKPAESAVVNDPPGGLPSSEAPRGYRAELIRELLEAHPGAGNQELAKLFLDRMHDKGYREDKPMLTIAQLFSQSKSTARKKAAAGTTVGGGSADGSGPHRYTSKPLTRSEPTLSDLMRVKDIADERGDSITDLAEQVTSIEQMAEEVGGLSMLKQCLQALARLSGSGD